MPLRLPANPHPASKPFAAIQAPGSKSVTNRVLLLSALAEGTSWLTSGLEAEDTRWMRQALRACGIRLEEPPSGWQVEGGRIQQPDVALQVGASGTTLRFLLPVLALHLREPVRLEGDVRLFERPLAPLLQALAPLDVQWEASPGQGLLTPAHLERRRLEVEVDAGLSSQFVTGLALAAASLPEGGRLRWQGSPASASYLDLTAHWLRRFGCDSHRDAQTWEIPGGRLQARQLAITGDWSGAAAFFCAGAVTGRGVQVHPLDPNEPQGDRAILDILEAAGCRARCLPEGTITLDGALQRGLRADLTGCPDLGPVLAATAALAPGPSCLTGLHTLPLKECDRLEASAELVHWLGGRARIEGDHTLHIEPGPPRDSRPPFDPRNDHRMAFAAAVGGLLRGGAVLDPHCVAKTFPTFWDVWEAFLMG